MYRGVPVARRHAAHRALADALEDDPDADRRTWHRSAATIGPDDEIAGELERSAQRARLRGGLAVAAVALERAADLTSTPAGIGRRLTAAAMDAWMAGRADWARTLLERAMPLVWEPTTRADLDYVRGQLQLGSGNRQVAYDILLTAAETVAAAD